MECPEPVPLRSYIVMRADRIGLSSNASVRHCTRFGGKYILGLEFSGPVKFKNAEIAAAFNRSGDELEPVAV